jgi:hypothetical protein
MLEITVITLSAINFFIIFSSPVVFFNKKICNYLKVNLFDILIVNSIIFINILLFFSFFKINYIYEYFILFSFSYFIFFLKVRDYLDLFKNNLKIFLLFFLLLLCLFIKIAHDPHLAWDGVHHWLFKAKTFFDGGYIKDIKGLPFDFYPHLGTYLWSFFWKNSYLQIEYFGRFLFIFLFVVSFFSCLNDFQKNSRIAQSALILILIYLSTDLMLFSGYQEYLLFFTFYSCSRIFLLFEKKILKKEYTLIYLFLFGFCVNIFLWTKQEGFFHFFIINTIFLIHSKIKLNYKLIYIGLIFSFVILFLFVKIHFFGSFHFHENVINDSFSENLILSKLILKLFLISKYVIISFFKYPIWLLIIISLIFLFIKNRVFFKKNTFVITFICLEFILIYSIFLSLTSDLQMSLSLTLSRVVFPISGFLIFAIVDILNISYKLKK